MTIVLDSSFHLEDEIIANCFGSSLSNATKYSPFIRGVLKLYDIMQVNRIAAFAAQIGHETGGLSRLEENLNYSAEGLCKTWPNRFNPELAEECKRQPEKIANIVYANRLGNSDSNSGEGWKYRGRGLIQTTGKNNYRDLSWKFGIDFVGNPALLLEPVNAALAAGYYWDKNNLNRLADQNDIKAISRIINGGTIGLEDRISRYEKAKTILSKTKIIPV